MAKAANLHVRIDPDVKSAAEGVFASFGITLSDAINIFLHKSIMTNGLPFDMTAPRYNTGTLQAAQEVDDMIAGKIPKSEPMGVDAFFEEFGE